MTIYVRKAKTDNLLGRDVAARLGFVKRLDEIFGDMGQVKCTPVKIQLKDDSQRFRMSRLQLDEFRYLFYPKLRLN